MSELNLLEKRIRWTVLQDGLIAFVVFAMAILVLLAAATTAKAGITGRTAMVGALGLAFVWMAWVMLQAARALWPATGKASAGRTS